MTDFIWVASFPKSGSTWLRFILAHLLYDLGEDKSAIREMVPNMHDWKGPLKYEWQGAYTVKTHLARTNLPSRMHTRSAIHVCRNPLDVVDSTLSYMKLKTPEERENLINQFCINGTIEPWGKTLGYESWESNYDSWMQAANDFPVINLRYEDMLENPSQSIREIADFLSVDADDAKIRHVVSETSFDRMKKEEELELTGDKVGVFTDENEFNKQNFSFMRAGKKGGYEENLSDDEINRLKTRFGLALEKAGYL